MVLLDDPSLTLKSRSTSGFDIRIAHRARAGVKFPWVINPAENGKFHCLGGEQITASKGNPFRGSYSGDLGGPFGTAKSQLSINELRFQGVSTNGNEELSTAHLPIDGFELNNTTTEPPLLQYPSDIDALGADAVALSNPVNPIADASVTFAESIREGLPSIPGISLWERRVKALLGISGEFLNAEFGWLPLLDEITSFSKAVKHSRDILSQYKRDEGKLVRRRFNFPHTKSKTIINESPFRDPILLAKNGGSYSHFPTYSNTHVTGTILTYDDITRRSWFSGAFRYFIPNQDDSWKSVFTHGSSADHLLGTSLTPEILWELTPWSWAVDYFTNAQSVITNLQNFEIYGELLAYGYMMDETIRTRNVVWISSDKGTLPDSSVVSWIFSRKLRRAANPFGFGLTNSDLSPEQLAILAAAGITSLL